LRGKEKNESKLENEIAALKGKLTSVNDKIGGLQSDLAARDTANAQLQGNTESLQSQLAEYQNQEHTLLERIRELEASLSTARKDASKTLMSRILELEAMLQAERRKVEEFHMMPGIAEVSSRSSSIKTVAANSDIKKKKNSG